MNQTSGMGILQVLFHARTQTHFWHLQTQSYAEHKALGDFYEALLPLADEFMEVYIGIYGRENGDFAFKFQKYSQGIAAQYLKYFSAKIHSIGDGLEHGCLKNLTDEIAALSNKTLYLLSLQ